MTRRASGQRWIALVCVAAVSTLVACGGAEPGKPRSGIGGGSNGTGGSLVLGGGANQGGGAGTGPAPYSLPAGFAKTEHGGFKLGQEFDSATPPANVGAGGTSNSSTGCGTTILAVVRDFRGTCNTGNDQWCTVEPNGHPDFETFWGNGPTTGLVPDALGADSKPGYTGICEQNNQTATCPYGQETTTAANFAQWYKYVATVNKPFVIYLSLEPNGNVVTFQSDYFFPLDGQGWGNSALDDQHRIHNFGFTTEVHTQFKYSGGEQFTFIGDDDVWVFINKKLAVDLGGLHPQVTGTVNLDDKAAALGITPGKDYSLDLFHAERHAFASHFRVDTNLMFTSCGTIVPEVVK